MENNSPNNTNAVFTNKLQKSNVFVTKIEKIKLEEPVAVYDVTVNGTHNFLLENGTVVHNTHVQGLFDAITKEFKAVAGRGVDFTASDLREGLIAVIHYKCNDDDYAGQNKEKLNSPSATKIVRDEVSKALAKWVKSNTKLVREISLRATNIKAAKEEARKLTRAASNLKTHNKSVLVPNGKLIMSDKNCPPEKRELFIVEGDSEIGRASCRERV